MTGTWTSVFAVASSMSHFWTTCRKMWTPAEKMANIILLFSKVLYLHTRSPLPMGMWFTGIIRRLATIHNTGFILWTCCKYSYHVITNRHQRCTATEIAAPHRQQNQAAGIARPVGRHRAAAGAASGDNPSDRQQ